MVLVKNKELIVSTHKSLRIVYLFDFLKKREIMNLCVSEKSVFKPFLKVGNF